MVKLLKHFNVLNLILISLVFLLGHYEYGVYKQPLSVKVTSDKAAKAGKAGLKIDEGKKLLDRGGYMVVTDKNLFHTDRKLVQIKKEVEIPPPDLIVYGTIITDNLKLAYVEDKHVPFSTQGRGQRQRTVRLGEVLSGYTLKTVTPDKVEFVKDDKVLSVDVIDSNRKSRQGAQFSATGQPNPAAGNAFPGTPGIPGVSQGIPGVNQGIPGVPPLPVQNVPQPLQNIPLPPKAGGVSPRVTQPPGIQPPQPSSVQAGSHPSMAPGSVFH